MWLIQRRHGKSMVLSSLLRQSISCMYLLWLINTFLVMFVAGSLGMAFHLVTDGPITQLVRWEVSAGYYSLNGSHQRIRLEMDLVLGIRLWWRVHHMLLVRSAIHRHIHMDMIVLWVVTTRYPISEVFPLVFVFRTFSSRRITWKGTICGTTWQ